MNILESAIRGWLAGIQSFGDRLLAETIQLYTQLCFMSIGENMPILRNIAHNFEYQFYY